MLVAAPGGQVRADSSRQAARDPARAIRRGRGSWRGGSGPGASQAAVERTWTYSERVPAIHTGPAGARVAVNHECRETRDTAPVQGVRDARMGTP
jgi:hypothetical protein